jgi:hypothetical protein
MAKRVVIVLSLVEESVGKANKDIEEEILNDLCEGRQVIPWCKKVEIVHCEESEGIALSTSKIAPINSWI